MSTIPERTDGRQRPDFRFAKRVGPVVDADALALCMARQIEVFRQDITRIANLAIAGCIAWSVTANAAIASVVTR